MTPLKIYILFISLGMGGFSICTSVLASNISTRSLNIPLTIQERTGVSRVNEPVQSGVPLPRGAQIFNTNGLSIVDGTTGQVVDADFIVTARWGGAPSDTTKPIKWILATLKCSLPANGTAHFILTDYRPNPPATKITLDQTSESGVWIIDTGAAVFKIASSGFDLFRSVKIGGVELINSSLSNGPYYTLAGTTYFARDAVGGSALSLFRMGNLSQSLTLKIKGSHRTFSDHGDEDLDFNTFLTFFAGSGVVKMHHTVQNNRDWVPLENNADFREVGSPNSVYADEIGISLGLNLGGSLSWKLATSPAASPLEGSNLSETLSVYQDSTGDSLWDYWKNLRGTGTGTVDTPLYSPSAYVSFQGFQIKQGSTLVNTGNKMSGYLDLSGTHGGVTVAIRDFWQNFPKALRATPEGTIQIALFPDEFRARHNLRVGEQKTHEILLYFHGPTASDMSNVGGGFDKPLLALAPSSWYTQMTRAIPAVSTDTDNAYRFSTIDANESLNQKDVTPHEFDAYQARHIEGPGYANYSFNGLDEAIPASQMYSWMDYGDMPIDFEQEYPCQDPATRSVTGQYGWKYDADYGLLVNFLRSGDFRFFDYGMAAIQHVSDIDMMHHGRQSGRGIDDFLDGGMFGHSQHNNDGVLNPHRNGNPNTPCWGGNWNGTPTADMIYGAGALTLAYWITGNPALSESLSDIADWTAFYTFNYGTDSGRSTANILNTLSWAYEFTGKEDYLTALNYIADNNTVLRNPMQEGWHHGRLGDAFGHFISVLHTGDDVTRDNQFSAFINTDISLDFYSGDAFRADAYGWGAMLLPDKKDFLSKAQEAFESAMLWPAWYGNYNGIQSVWQIKEWVNALKAGHSFQLALYDLLGGLKFTPSSPVVTPAGGRATQNTSPTAQMAGGPSLEGGTGETLNFDGLSSSDLETPASELHYFWDFGDGSTATDPTPTHVYQTAGIWTVCLWVSDGESVGRATQTATVSFVNHSPIANAGEDLKAPEDVEITFDGSASSDSDDQPLTYEWNFGDGQTATGITASHIFSTPGEYSVQLTVNDGELSATDTLKVTVQAVSDESFTLTFQEGANGYTGAKDTRLWSKSGNTNYGSDTELYMGRQNYPELNSLIAYDLSALPAGSKIESAVLTCTLSQESFPGTVHVHRLTEDWTESGASWVSRDGSNNWSDAGATFVDDIPGIFSTENGKNVFKADVTSMVQDWMLGQVNHGFALTLDENYNYDYVYLYSKEVSTVSDRPQLVVTYMPLETIGGQITAVRLGQCDTCTGTSAHDVRLDQNSPSTVGNTEQTHILGRSSGGIWLLYYFDAASLPSTTQIRSARLKVFYQWSGGARFPSDQMMHIYPITDPSGLGNWEASTVSFNKRKTAQAWTSSGGNLLSSLGSEILSRCYEPWSYDNTIVREEWWDVTNLVQAWISNSASNQGIAIQGVVPSYSDPGSLFSSSHSDSTLRPFLEIEYEGTSNPSAIPPQPSALRATHDGAGRTFITWNKIENTDYRVYRHTEPINQTNIFQATLLTEIDQNKDTSLAPLRTEAEGYWLPPTTVNIPYSIQFTTSGSVTVSSWTASNLPPGLSISANGVLSGTPTQSGGWQVSIVPNGNYEYSFPLSLKIETEIQNPPPSNITIQPNPYQDLFIQLPSGSQPKRWRARENEAELTSEEALYVQTPSEAGTFYYAVTAVREGQENTEDFSELNALVSPLEEEVGDGLPVNQWGPYFFEYYGTHTQWIYAAWPGEKFHNQSDFPVLFRVSARHPFDVEQVHPVQFTYGGYSTYYTMSPYSSTGSSSIIITPESRTPQYDENPGRALTSWFVGYRDNLGKRDSIPSQGTFHYYGIEATRFIANWITQGQGKTLFNIDPQKIYAWGGSQGGAAVLFLALYAPDLFAAAQANLPVFNWYNENSCGNMWTDNTLMYLAGTPSEAVKDTEGVLTTEALDASKKLTALISSGIKSFPTLLVVSSWNDGTLQWDADQVHFANVVQTSGLPIIFAWEDRGHDTSLGGDLTYGYLNKAVIGFSNCSLASLVPPENANGGEGESCGTETDYGAGSLHGEPLGYEHGQYPQHVSPDLNSIVDTATEFQVKLYEGSSETESQGTIDITPRRVQNFLPSNGTVLVWQNLDSSQVQIQTGTITVESSGLWTVPGFIFTKTGNRLIVNLLECQSGNQAPISTTATLNTVEDTQSSPVTPEVIDPDLQDHHTFTLLTQPLYGTAEVVNNRLIYTPQNNFYGVDTFSYQATDICGLSVTGTAEVNVSSVNDSPIRIAGTFEDLSLKSTAGLQSLNLTNLTYVAGPENELSQTLAYQITSLPDSGTAEIYLADGVTKVSNGNFYNLIEIQGIQVLPKGIGLGTFSLKVSDNGGVENGGNDTLMESLTITVTSAGGTFSLNSNSYSIAENGSSASVTVLRSGNVDEAATIQYATSDGSATEAIDYTPVSGSLSFEVGTTEANISIPILDDSEEEENETFILTLSDPSSNALLGSPASATLTILENDIPDSEPPTISITSPSNNATVSDSIVITANVSDNVGVAQVVYYLSGTVIGTVTNSPFSLSFDTRTKPNGPYTLSAQAYDTSNNTASSQDVNMTISNLNQAPTAQISYDSDPFYQMGESISFDASNSSDPDGNSLSYHWDFGDGSTSTDAAVNHGYSQAGNYTIVLTVSDGNLTDTEEITLTIYPLGEEGSIELQQGVNGYTGCEDVHIRRGYDNYGGGQSVTLYNGLQPDYRPLIKFNLASISLPENAILLQARLSLTCYQVGNNTPNNICSLYRLTQAWVEGTGTYSNTTDGASWTTYDGSSLWAQEGGDFDQTTDFGKGPNGLIASQPVTAPGEISFDISSIFSQWLSGEIENHGLILLLPDNADYKTINDRSREYTANLQQRPKLTIQYIVPSSECDLNQAPTASSAILQTLEDAESTPITPKVTDLDLNDTHTFTLLTQPLHGIAEVSENQLNYTPITNFNGVDSFTYRATDPCGLSVEGVATVTVTSVNDSPTRIAGSIENKIFKTTDGLQSLGFSDLAYTAGPENEADQTLSYIITTLPGSGVGTVYLSDGATPVFLGIYSLEQLQGMKFLPKGAGTGTFSFQVVDDGGIQNGGVDTLTESQGMTVSVAGGILDFSSASYSVNEGGGSVLVTVNRSISSEGPITVNYATANNTALSDADYTATAGTLSLGDGVNSAVFSIPILEDTSIEGSENFTVMINSPVGALLGTQITATISIVDNDFPDTTAPTISITYPQNGDTVVGTINLSVNASDDHGIQKIVYELDGTELATVTTSPYSYLFNTKQAANGNYTLSAKAFDTNNNIGTSNYVSITISNPVNHPPTAVIQSTHNDIIKAGDEITFDGSGSSDPDGTTLTYTWDFGDFITDVLPTVVHSYQKEGTYTVKLTVSDGELSNTAQLNLTLYPLGQEKILTLSQGTSSYQGCTDTLVRASYEGNYGAADYLTLYNSDNPDYRFLIKFDLSSAGISANATLISSQLKFYATSSDNITNQIYSVTRSWAEGTGTYGNTLNGATWNTYDGSNAWTAAGGDYDQTTDFGNGPNGLIASQTVSAGSVSFDVSSIVAKWMNGTLPNNGLVILLPSSITYQQITYASKEASTTSQRPQLVIDYFEPSSDPETPAVSIIDPPTNVAGNLSIEVNASDNSGIKRVVYFLNGRLIKVLDTAPYIYVLNTKDFENGNYTLQVKAVDANENINKTQVIHFTISNPGNAAFRKRIRFSR